MHNIKYIVYCWLFFHLAEYYNYKIFLQSESHQKHIICGVTAMIICNGICNQRYNYKQQRDLSPLEGIKAEVLWLSKHSLNDLRDRYFWSTNFVVNASILKMFEPFMECLKLE